MKFLSDPFDDWLKDFCSKHGIKTKEEFDDFVQKLLEKMDQEENLNPKKPEGECYFCHKQTTDWDFCYGCEQYICDECVGNVDLAPMGKHHVSEHKSQWN